MPRPGPHPAQRQPAPPAPAPTPQPPAPPQPQPRQDGGDVYDSPLVQIAVCLAEQLRDGVPFMESLGRCLVGEYQPEQPEMGSGRHHP